MTAIDRLTALVQALLWFARAQERLRDNHLSATASWSPERRHRGLLLLSIAPMVFAAFGVVAVLAPSLLGIVWPAYDHCLRHEDHHVHLCLAHLPTHVGNATSWLVLTLAMGWTSVQAANALAELYRAWKCARQLRVLGKGNLELGANILPTPAPLCLLAGVFQPTLFLSRGLLAGISPEQVAVILHHEQAHAARHDILARLVARAGTVFMWPSAVTKHRSGRSGARQWRSARDRSDGAISSRSELASGFARQ